MSRENRLTLEEKATNWETMKHIHLVGRNIHKIVTRLLKRADEHDLSKLDPPEVEDFTKYTPVLSGLTYGSKEFDECKSKMQKTLDHHYANNRHHPEHHKQGINDMNLVDVMEMFCDWAASCKRHEDGNLRKSIEINGKRFNMDPQLVKIFENSVDLIE